MKNLLSLFICLSLVTFYSCGDDDNEDNSVKLAAKFTYLKDDAIVDSPYTTMYIYDTKNEDTSKWEYNKTSHNMERTDGTVVYPKYTFLSDISGVIGEEIENKISYLYIAICGVDPSQTIIDKFVTNGSSIKIEKTLSSN